MATAKSKRVVFNFATVQDFLDRCEFPQTDGFYNNSTEMGIWATTFTGTATYEESIDLIVNGCDRLEKSILQTTADILPEGVQGLVQTIRYDVAGDDVNVGRYLDGEPECMANYETELGHGNRCVVVSINGSMSADISADLIENRGAAVCALIDCLESAGYRTEVHVYTGVRQVNVPVVNVCVKQAQDRLDLTRLAYCLAHPSFLRRQVFRFLETFPKEQRAPSYGKSDSQADPIVESDITLMSNGMSTFSTIEGCRKWLNDTIKECNEFYK
jgi:hypothetical protein